MNEEIISLLTGINLEKIRNYLDEFGLIDVIKAINCLDVTYTQRKKFELIYELTKRINSFQCKLSVIDFSSKAGELLQEYFQF